MFMVENFFDQSRVKLFKSHRTLEMDGFWYNLKALHIIHQVREVVYKYNH